MSSKKASWTPGSGFGALFILGFILIVASWAGCDPNQTSAPTVYEVTR